MWGLAMTYLGCGLGLVGICLYGDSYPKVLRKILDDYVARGVLPEAHIKWLIYKSVFGRALTWPMWATRRTSK